LIQRVQTHGLKLNVPIAIWIQVVTIKKSVRINTVKLAEELTGHQRWREVVMKKYKVSFKQTLTGYIEVFSDNEDHAISRLYKESPLRGQLVIETDDIEYQKVIKLEAMKEGKQ
jgi:hypothetical protein